MRPNGVQRHRTTVLLICSVCVAGAGCASVQTVNGPGEFGFLAKGGTCLSLARDTSTMAGLGYSFGHDSKGKDGKMVDPWRLLAFVMDEPYSQRGWTRNEIAALAKEIIAADYPDKITEILAADLYFETACNLLQNGHPVPRFSTVTAKMISCLHQHKRKQGLQCAARAMQ
jgi:hypothetical protein